MLGENAYKLMERGNPYLSPAEIKLLLSITSAAQRAGGAAALRWRDLESDTGLSETTVGVAVKSLVRRGVVRIDGHQRGCLPTAYSVNWDWQPAAMPEHCSRRELVARAPETHTVSGNASISAE